MRRGRPVDVAVVASVIAMAATAEFARAQSSSRSTSQVIPANAQSYAMLRQYSEIDGAIVDVRPNQITLRVPYKHQVPTNGQQSIDQINRSMAQLKRAQMAAMSGQRLNVAQYSRQLQDTINRNLRIAQDFIDFVLPLDPKVSIRKLAKGVEFDDKGNPKPRNASRGVLGYPGTRSDLVEGAAVKVTFLRAYGPVAARPTPKFIGAEPPPPPPPAAAPRIGRIILQTDEFGSPVISPNR